MKKLLLLLLALVLIGPVAEADARKGKGARKKGQKRHAKPTYYYNSDGTLTDRPSPPAKRTSAYKGDKVPENDGQKKNEHRNMNYNSGQPLPSSSGNR